MGAMSAKKGEFGLPELTNWRIDDLIQKKERKEKINMKKLRSTAGGLNKTIFAKAFVYFPSTSTVYFL